MKSREARIERIIRVRDERLKKAIAALEEARSVERKALAELLQASNERQGAERARRDLIYTPSDIRAFIEAEDWLRSCSIAEEIATRRVRHARQLLGKAEQRVKEAHMKVRQLTQLQTRLREAAAERQKRVERVLEDEIGQRVARRSRGSSR